MIRGTFPFFSLLVSHHDMSYHNSFPDRVQLIRKVCFFYNPTCAFRLGDALPFYFGFLNLN
jgi:hypothetical protein